VAKKSKKAKHPLQPLVKDSDGVVRFKVNEIVRTLLDFGPLDMNKLAMMYFSQEDREQFAQLIGYSLSGFGELTGYVSDETYEAAASQEVYPEQKDEPKKRHGEY
jgi:hypothetical protein